jgi:serine/threonine protein kinase
MLICYIDQCLTVSFYFALTFSFFRKPADIWSAGALLHLLLSGTLPFVGSKERLFSKILETPVELEGPLWVDQIGPDAKDLLKRMLTRDQDKRITIHEVLSHPWLKVYRNIILYGNLCTIVFY